MRILLVESYDRIAAAITAALEAEAIRVDRADNGEDALLFLRDYIFDLVLLNLHLPNMDGSALISRIRSARHQTPILALSAAPQARLRALSAGADDVVERDINRAELIARIRAIVRRSRGYSRSLLRVGDLTLDVDQHEVRANGVRMHFSAKEFAILELLVLRRNMIMTKEIILAQLYGGMDAPEIKIIDVFICKVRTKLAKAGLPKVISTVWGRGYTVRDNTAGGFPDCSAPTARAAGKCPRLIDPNSATISELDFDPGIDCVTQAVGQHGVGWTRLSRWRTRRGRSGEFRLSEKRKTAGIPAAGGLPAEGPVYPANRLLSKAC